MGDIVGHEMDSSDTFISHGKECLIENRNLSIHFFMEDTCLFCKIVSGDIPCRKVAEDEETIAFLDIFPLSRGHTLVIPKAHYAKLHELPEATMTSLGRMVLRVATALGACDYNILQNNGTKAHQIIPHVHFHIIPQCDDSKESGFGGALAQLWKPVAQTDEELVEVASELSKKVEKLTV